MKIKLELYAQDSNLPEDHPNNIKTMELENTDLVLKSIDLNAIHEVSDINSDDIEEIIIFGFYVDEYSRIRCEGLPLIKIKVKDREDLFYVS